MSVIALARPRTVGACVVHLPGDAEIWAVCSDLVTTPWLDYELHPEYGAVHRRTHRARRPDDSPVRPLPGYRHWVNTRDDYWVRARGTDGVEVGAWLSNMLQPKSPDPTSTGGADGQHAKFEECRDDLRRYSVHSKRGAYWRHPWSRYEDEPPPPAARRRGWLQLCRARVSPPG